MNEGHHILTDEELRAIKMVNDSPKVPHGRPVKLIEDLLNTIYHLKKEKKKWQRLSEKRKNLCAEAAKILNTAFNNSEELDDK